ncbi:4631_t:CDS:1, partial [Funneliformis caledonium]
TALFFVALKQQPLFKNGAIKISHSSLSATLSSLTVLGKTLQLWILSFNCFQMFSIRFRSGEFANHNIILQPILGYFC